MQVENTTDKIELVLGSNVTTNQLHINATYNIISSTGITPAKTSTTSSNTTAIDIVPAPSSGNKHQLRYCNIFNSDVSSEIVTIRTNYNGTTRIAFSTTLQVNEYIQYTHRTGWKAFDVNGSIKNTTRFFNTTDYKGNEFIITSNINTTTTLSSGTTLAVYLGKATGTYNDIMLNHMISTAPTTVTWAEIGIYKGTPSLGSGTALTRCGFIDTTGIWTTGGQYRFPFIPVTGISTGDDLWAVYGISNSGTSAVFRGPNVVDDIGAGFIQTCGSSRPSLSSSIQGTIASSSTGIFSFWNGI